MPLADTNRSNQEQEERTKGAHKNLRRSRHSLIAMTLVPVVGLLSVLAVQGDTTEASTPNPNVTFVSEPKSNQLSPEMTITLDVNVAKPANNKWTGVQVWVSGSAPGLDWILNLSNACKTPATTDTVQKRTDCGVLALTKTRAGTTTNLDINGMQGAGTGLNFGTVTTTTHIGLTWPSYADSEDRILAGDVITITLAAGFFTVSDTVSGTVNARVIGVEERSGNPGGNTSTGAISGATTSVTADSRAPVFVQTSLGDGTAGTAFTGDASATTTGATPISYSVSSGSLPAGLSLDASTGQITGTPTVAGNYDFTIRASTSDSPTVRSTQRYQGSITANPATPVFVLSSLGGGEVGAAFSGNAGATTSGPSSITYSVSAGSLPAGLTLNTTTGMITGTPTSAGNYTFTIRATTGDTPALISTRQFTGSISAETSAPMISGSNSVSVTAPSTAVATYTANEPVSTWGLAGTNAGLFDISSSGVVTFKAASTAGTYSIIVEATDAAENKGTRAVTVTVSAAAGAQPELPPPSAGASPPTSGATNAPTKSEAARKVVPGFAANSTKLTKEMRKEIRIFLRTNPGLNQVTCRGFTSAPATAQDRALARERGRVTCDLIKKLRPEANVTIRSGSHTDKPGAEVRRVRITLR